MAVCCAGPIPDPAPTFVKLLAKYLIESAAVPLKLVIALLQSAINFTAIYHWEAKLGEYGATACSRRKADDGHSSLKPGLTTAPRRATGWR